MWQPHPERFDNELARQRFTALLETLPRLVRRVLEEAAKSSGRDSAEVVGWFAGEPVANGKGYRAIVQHWGEESMEERCWLLGYGGEDAGPFLALFERNGATPALDLGDALECLFGESEGWVNIGSRG